MVHTHPRALRRRFWATSGFCPPWATILPPHSRRPRQQNCGACHQHHANSGRCVATFWQLRYHFWTLDMQSGTVTVTRFAPVRTVTGARQPARLPLVHLPAPDTGWPPETMCDLSWPPRAVRSPGQQGPRTYLLGSSTEPHPAWSLAHPRPASHQTDNVAAAVSAMT